MGWKECNKMDEKLKFIARYLEGEKIAPLMLGKIQVSKTNNQTNRCLSSVRFLKETGVQA